MIVLSLILVIVAAVALIAGFFQGDDLTLIYAAITACILALIFLGVGVLQRKRARPSVTGDEGYGPGAGRTPVRPIGASSRPATARDEDADTDTAEASGDTATATATRESDTDTDADADAGDTETAARGDAPTSSTRPVKRAAAPSGTDAAASAETDADDLHDFLASIKGIGPAKQDALVERFGSLEAIRAADVSELADVKGIGPSMARRIKDELGG